MDRCEFIARSLDTYLLQGSYEKEMHWYHLVIALAMLIPGLMILRARDRRRQRRWRQDIEDIRAGRKPVPSIEDAKNGTISLAATGFTVLAPVLRREDSTATVEWDRVEQIRAFKRDLFSIDLICWDFHCRDDDFVVIVNEHMLGFRELQKAVQARFGVKEADWWKKVVHPAFAENMTVLWSKDETTQDSG